MTVAGRSRPAATVLLALVTLLNDCAGSPTAASATLAAGAWGGAHIALTVGSASSTLEFDCAHGDIPTSFTVDAGQRFELRGRFVREHGGPVREGEAPDEHPAVYRGTVAGARMTLTVQLTDSGEVVGTYALVRGSSGRIVKCR